MRGKKFLTLAVSAALGLSMLAGCGDRETGTQDAGETQKTTEVQKEAPATEEPEQEPEQKAASDDPVSAITDSYYSYGYMVDTMHMSYYFHFYDEQPVLGKVFYGGMCMNQINFVGTYDVVEEEYAYSCYADRAAQEAETPTEGTAPYTVHFYDWDGNELDKCGYDGEYLYSNMTAITGVGGENIMLARDAEPENSDFADEYAGELGQIYAEYVAEDEATSTIALYHNGTYLDLMDMMVEGTWTMAESADGYEFTLTPDSASDTAAVLAATGDFATATYTPDGGEAVALINNAESGPAVSYTITGKIAIPGQETEADIIGTLYDDGTVKLVASAFGTDFEIDTGTYTVDENYTFTFEFDTVGELTSGFGETGAELAYAQTGNEVFGDMDVVLTIELPQ